MIRCQNSACKFCFCKNCRIEWHTDMTCRQYKAFLHEERKKKEFKERDENLFREWIAANAKDCPGCKNPIQKNGGCNHMTCLKCKHQFCWLCMADYVSTHFQTGPCKQFT